MFYLSVNQKYVTLEFECVPVQIPISLAKISVKH